MSGDRLQTKLEYFERFLESQSPDYFEELAESISKDRDLDLDPEDLTFLSDMQTFLSSHLIQRRGLYVSCLERTRQ